MSDPQAATFERAKSLFIEGVALVEAGDPAAAEARFEASLALLPDRASTLLNLGTVRLALGRPEQALAALERSVALDASQPDAWCQQGLALARLHRLDDAIASFERALALDATDYSATFSLARLDLADRKPDVARKRFEALLATMYA